MSDALIRRFDRASMLLLLLWAGAGLGFGALAPLLFAKLPSRDLAGQIAGAMVGRLDTLAWGAFLLPVILSYGSRWMGELEEGPIGPAMLWALAALIPILLTLLSATLVSPRLAQLRAQMAGPVEALALDNPLRAAYARNHQISNIAFFVRLALALVLGLTVERLPRPGAKTA